MKFTAPTLDALKLELETAFAATPAEPQPLYACATADMPPASAFQYCILWNTTLGKPAVSDGTDWYSVTIGAAI